LDLPGTNTDAVLLDIADRSPVLASQKVPTTALVTEGIRDCVKAVLQSAPKDVKASDIRSLSIGTTVRFVAFRVSYLK
jgi:N-methylhydantoinase A/oxoprolinase/acetone carboxylase beta subunit